MDLYRKPGDALDVATPVLFDVAARKEIEIDHALFPNAYSLSPPVWWKDGRAFTFEYNQRGHQLYRVIEVNGQTGKARALIEEQSKTFIYYNNLGRDFPAGASTGTTSTTARKSSGHPNATAGNISIFTMVPPAR